MVRDFLGQPMEVGDILACAVMNFRTARLSFVVILSIEPNPRGDDYEDEVRVYYLKRTLVRSRRTLLRSGVVIKIPTETIRACLDKGLINEDPENSWYTNRPSREVAQEILEIQAEVLAMRPGSAQTNQL